MRLNYVEINNFRSIKYAKIDFDPRCRILVGMNDTGKSNVLKALASYDKKNPIKEKDIRLERDGRIPSNFCYVKYTFSLDNSDYDNLVKSLSNKIYGINKSLCSGLAKEIINSFSKGIIIKINNDLSSPRINFSLEDEGKKAFLNSRAGILIAEKNIWKKINKNNITTDADTEPDIKNRIENFKKSSFISKETIGEIPDIFRSVLTDNVGDEMIDMIFNTIFSLIQDKFKVIFWKSNDSKHKIPESVSISKFLKNPNDFLFIRNLFEFYERNVLNTQKFDDDFITEKIKKFLSDPLLQRSFGNYLEKVANEFTKNFSSIWKNYTYNEETIIDYLNDNNNLSDDIDGFKFNLESTGGKQLCFTIKEKNDIYDISDRSEGFRKFITFLLIVSTKNIHKGISNNLFIIDEPETSLHHSAARDFRKELIKMTEGTNNYVAYGTHSISMIDQSNFNRHYVVKREQEITKVINAEEAAKKLHKDTKHRTHKRKKYRNILEHEILYDRLGYSIYENLKEKNIMFEGWTDKKLFEKYLEYTNIKSEDLDFGVAHAYGVDSYKYISPIIELAERKLWIISDSDSAAKKERDNYLKIRGYGKWLLYKDIDESIKAVVGEDFIKDDYIIGRVMNYIKDSKNNLNTDKTFTKDDLGNISHGNTKGMKIQLWIQNILLKNSQGNELQNKIIEKQAKKIKNDIKDAIFTYLTKDDIIIDDYKKLYNGIKKIIKGEEKNSSLSQAGKNIKKLILKKLPPQSNRTP